jgi:hypothetical protein
MATIAEVITGVTNVLNGLYPTLTVYPRKRPLGPVRTPLSGFAVGDIGTAGCFILVTGDPDPIDTAGSFETVTDRFTLDINYAKVAPPGDRDEDDEIRVKRAAILNAFNVTHLVGVPTVLMVGFDNGRPYQEVSGNDTINASVQSVSYLLFTPRGTGP